MSRDLISDAKERLLSRYDAAVATLRLQLTGDVCNAEWKGFTESREAIHDVIVAMCKLNSAVWEARQILQEPRHAD